MKNLTKYLFPFAEYLKACFEDACARGTPNEALAKWGCWLRRNSALIPLRRASLLLLTSLLILVSYAFFVEKVAAVIPDPTPIPLAPVPTCITSGGQCTAVSVACKSLGPYVYGGYGSPFCPASNPQCCVPLPTPTPTPTPTPAYICLTVGGQCTTAYVACKSLGSYVVRPGYGDPYCPAANPQCCVPSAPTPTSAPFSTPQLSWKQIADCTSPSTPTSAPISTPIPASTSCTQINNGCGGAIPPCCTGLVCDSTTYQCVAPTGTSTPISVLTPTKAPQVSAPTPTLPPGIIPTAIPAPTPTPLPGYTDCAIGLYGENFCQGFNALGPRQGCRKDLDIGVCFDQPTGSRYESYKFVDCTPCNPLFIPTPTPTISPVDICRDECDLLDQDPEETFRCYQRCRGITRTPTPTITPILLPGSVQLTLALAQQGLTSIPVNRNRTITVVLHGADDQIVAKTGTVDYSNGTFKGTVNLGLLPSGSYKLIVKAGNFLRSPITNLVISGAAASAQITLTAGLVSDQNNDNIDAISFYANGLRTCFGSSLGIKKCDNPEDVDLNGDANVDAIDYQIYLKGIRSLRQGLPVE